MGCTTAVFFSGVVRVTLDGQSTFYSLDANREFTVSSDNGFNTLRIENGTVRVVATDCAELQCIRRGSISLAGESIVCLPHRLVIDIQRVKTSSLDAVVR